MFGKGYWKRLTKRRGTDMTIRHFRTDDWEAVYKDKKILMQDRTISFQSIVNELKGEQIDEYICYSDEPEVDEYVVNAGRFPDSLEEIMAVME